MKIVFVSLDTTRADHLGCYGYPKPTTPTLDRIAAQGVLFERCIAGDIPTEPAHTALFTGRRGIRTGIVVHGPGAQYLPKDIPLLPEILRRAGLTTAAVDNLYNLKEWFARGYRYYINSAGPERHIDGATVNRLAIAWLRQHAHEDFFLFLHYWDAHTPYLPPPEYAARFWQGDPCAPAKAPLWERVRRHPTYPFFKHYHYDLLGPVTDPDYVSALYDAELRYLDDRLAELDGALHELGIADETLLVLVGDHGENLFEHHAYWDHAGLYESNVHVPLILRWPGRLPAGRRVGAVVQHVDVLPTLLELAGIPTPPELDGRSLLPLIHGQSDAYYHEVFLNECSWRAARGVRTDRWKLIWNLHPGPFQGLPPVELYDLSQDPAEARNVASEHPEVVRELCTRILWWVEESLQGRPDPLRAALQGELPGITRLRRALAAYGLTWEEWSRSLDPDLLAGPRPGATPAPGR